MHASQEMKFVITKYGEVRQYIRASRQDAWLTSLTT
jgi:hypothetical protein